jgi:tRNA(Ile)-lysidine synthase
MQYIPDPLKLFERVETNAPVIVAVSGGSDSIALLLLASTWAKSVDASLQVVTIDHGLRPEAAAEAAFVSGVCEGLGLPHLTIAWDGQKPESGVSQAARNARYQFLEEFALDIGASTILVGHTANDQAETILMRNARRGQHEQARGLSGISPLMLLPARTKLLRPLLGVTRKSLRDYLKTLNQSWIEDPSNFDESYERVRIRNRLAEDEGQIDALCRFATLSGRLRKSVNEKAALVLSEHIVLSEGPMYAIANEVVMAEAPAIQRLVLQVLIAMAGGAEYFVSMTKLEQLIKAQDDIRLTLGNCVVEKDAGCIKFYRETRNLPSVVVGPGDTVLWDGRFFIDNTSSISYFCGPIDKEQLQGLEDARGRKFSIKPRAVLGATPCLCGDGDDFILPFVKGFEMPVRLGIVPCVRSIEYYCPEYDFSLLKIVDALKTRMGSLGHVD